MKFTWNCQNLGSKSPIEDKCDETMRDGINIQKDKKKKKKKKGRRKETLLKKI